MYLLLCRLVLVIAETPFDRVSSEKRDSDGFLPTSE